MKRTTLILASFTLALTAFAAGFQFRESDSSSVDIRQNSEGQVVETTRTTSYELVRQFESDSLVTTLIKKVVETTAIEGLDGSDGKLTLTARRTQAKPYDKLIFTLQESAHDAAYMGEGLLLTWLHGCCDSATTYRAYNLNTGKLVITYDDHTGESAGSYTTPFLVEVPNTNGLRRFVGILNSSATRDFKPAERDGRQKTATLHYAGPNGAIEAYDIYLKVPQNYGANAVARIVDLSGKGEVYGNRITLWGSDGVTDPAKALNGFGIEITLWAEKETKITLPFGGDRVNLEGITLPEEVRVEKAR